MTDLLEQLRQQTHPAHLEVEALSGLMDDDLTLEGYGAVLLAFAGVYGPLEARLLSLPLPAALELPRRLKAGRLRADLEALRLEAPDLEILDLGARGAAEPDLGWLNAETALGALYVLEGATLGGQLISRRLSARFGLSAGHGLAFFSSYGSEVGAMWKAFRTVLLSVSGPDQQRERAAVAGANATFRVFAGALRSLGGVHLPRPPVGR